MKISKSILNPIRATRNGAAVSLSFLRRSKKRGGCGSEPSSPKVTCIGQVKVKSKKKSKQHCRSVSRRRTGGEVSFRKAEQESLRRRKNHQRWVHLPISACLLFPCCKNSSCITENNNNGGVERGCCRWLVCGGEGGRRGEIEVVFGGDAAEEEMMCVGSLRRHVFEDFEVKNGRIEVKGRGLEVEEEEGLNVSICMPPKNALLIMRCRSDPMKMAALVNRCNWECQNYEDTEEEEEENYEDKLVNWGDEEEEEVQLEINDGDDDGEEEEVQLEINDGDDDEEEGGEEVYVNVKEANERNDVVSLPEKEEEEETEELKEEEEEDGEKEAFQKNEETLLPDCLMLMMCEPKLSMEVSKETWVRSTDFVRWLPERPRKAVAKGGGGDRNQFVKRRASVDSKPRPPGIPAPPASKNDQPPRSSF